MNFYLLLKTLIKILVISIVKKSAKQTRTSSPQDNISTRKTTHYRSIKINIIKYTGKYIENLIDDASNQPFKFKTKNWVEINNESRETHI